jgi:HEPN domain-containing protein/predicted nucleotidyltransferase
MKTSIAYLPEAKQRELHAIVRMIRETFAGVDWIILFGSYARDQWVETLFPNGATYRYQSDYDILLVAKKKDLDRQNKWYALQDRLEQAPEILTPVSLIYHNVNYFNARLAEGQYFFTDIKKEGILLYDSGRNRMAEARDLAPAENKHIAEGYFEQWFESAKAFFIDFRSALDRGSLKNAAFHLHQATEHSYAAILLVFSGYNPHTHNLRKLGMLAAIHEPGLKDIFPRNTKENRRRFELLKKAYIEARYSKQYSITREELQWLAERVEKLQEVAERICQEKIASFG